MFSLRSSRVVQGVNRMKLNPPWRRKRKAPGQLSSQRPMSSAASMICSAATPLFRRPFSCGEKFSTPMSWRLMECPLSWSAGRRGSSSSALRSSSSARQ